MYLTTAIDYANGSPHLGHAYEKVLADALARVQRLKGEAVYWVTGLDEHGQKVQQAALAAGVAPQAHCDGIAAGFQALCGALDISHDDYIRTTEPRHKAVVAEILQVLYDDGLIYKAEYTGFYSVRNEQFVQPKDRLEDGTWPESYGEVVSLTEQNYFFALSRFQDWLIAELKARPDWIFPAFRRSQVLEFLKEPLNDLCISRPITRLSWGIPLPFDNEYVTYVWFDALINYISVLGYPSGPLFAQHWDSAVHVIGKDILVPPHAVYWPIMLHALKLPLPKQLIVHGWWLVRGEKMSKSTGLRVDPMELVAAYGSDAFRYYVLREMVLGQDGDFSQESFDQRYKSDLGNDLGNLVSRLLHMIATYCGGVIPAPTLREAPEMALEAFFKQTIKEIPAAYARLELHKAIEETFSLVRAINRYAEERAPWKLSKDPHAQAALNTTLATMAEGLRLAAVLLLPVLTQAAPRILTLLGQAPSAPWSAEALQWSRSCLTGAKVGEKPILFPRK